jgi:hypothetical protein
MNILKYLVSVKFKILPGVKEIFKAVLANQERLKKKLS